MSTRTATCSCGQLSASTHTDPVRISVCHCLACQKRTGSVFGAQARFAKDSVELSGTAKEYSRVGDEGGKITFYFCPECGAIVYYRLHNYPDLIAIPVGAFANPDFPAPAFSVYEAHKHGWVQMPPGIEHLD